jgi:hypothetical protein
MYIPPLTCRVVPGDVTAAGTGQESDRMRDVLGRAEPAQRDFPQQRFTRRIGQCLCHVGVDESGRHAVDGDVAAAHFLRQRLGEADQRRLAAA